MPTATSAAVDIPRITYKIVIGTRPRISEACRFRDLKIGVLAMAADADDRLRTAESV